MGGGRGRGGVAGGWRWEAEPSEGGEKKVDWLWS